MWLENLFVKSIDLYLELTLEDQEKNNLIYS